MSLLLDALKKAAVDKERSSRGIVAENQVTKNQVAKAKVVAHKSAQVSAEKVQQSRILSQQLKKPEQSPEEQRTDDEMAVAEVASAEILTLAIDTTTLDELSLDEEDLADDSDENLIVEGRPIITPDTDMDTDTEGKKNDSISAAHSAASLLTISDDALSLLIDKTNRDEKRRKTIALVSVTVLSLLIVVFGGLYYYSDMQAEIAAIERKHQIALQQMRAKAGREKTPEKTEIISNLVSDAKLEEKVRYAKEKIASEKKPVPATRKAPQKVKQKAAISDLTITKSRKTDPVAENLDAAWLAYEDGAYVDAKQLYSKVLRIEDDNRDAQLGLAAIAIIEKDNVRARRIYLALLQQDPRDPIATSALAGMSSDQTSLKADNDYLLSLLEKNPDSPELNFSVGNNYAQQKKWKSAQQYYFKAWQRDSENANYLFNLAVSLDQLGKPQQAINFYQQSLDKASNKQVSFSVAAVQKRIAALIGL